ncbi:unnamed protein product [Cylindrotheca closterium]|uniref:Chalcone isomerase domain-containing protein n=1 Tax=Cylindrotheca closterium TaxID=2856 RepID=A0AAD2CAA2_9STRA|nr:unnamed protein product [Cylindrotheca closterium]
MHPESIEAIKKEPSTGEGSIEQVLLDPSINRTIRIVMYREVDMETCITAILEALEPRMNGDDLDKLEEFKKLNPTDAFLEGAIIEMTVKGDTLVYKNVIGNVGSLKSERFAEAVCDAYYGAEPISPTHKESVVDGLS